MPEPTDSHASSDGRHLPVLAQPVEARPIDAQPVDAVGGALARRLAELPAPVVAAAGGFLAGVAAYVVARVLRRPAPARRRLGVRRRGARHEVVASRSFLVDVHLLKR